MRIRLVAAAVAVASLTACGSDINGTPRSSMYRDTCTAVTNYIDHFDKSAFAGSSREEMGNDFINLAKDGGDWEHWSAETRDEFQRGVNNAVDGKCS